MPFSPFWRHRVKSRIITFVRWSETYVCFSLVPKSENINYPYIPMNFFFSISICFESFCLLFVSPQTYIPIDGVDYFHRKNSLALLNLVSLPFLQFTIFSLHAIETDNSIQLNCFPASNNSQTTKKTVFLSHTHKNARNYTMICLSLVCSVNISGNDSLQYDRFTFDLVENTKMKF